MPSQQMNPLMNTTANLSGMAFQGLQTGANIRAQKFRMDQIQKQEDMRRQQVASQIQAQQQARAFDLLRLQRQHENALALERFRQAGRPTVTQREVTKMVPGRWPWSDPVENKETTVTREMTDDQINQFRASQAVSLAQLEGSTTPTPPQQMSAFQQAMSNLGVRMQGSAESAANYFSAPYDFMRRAVGDEEVGIGSVGMFGQFQPDYIR